jgi:hypothetical protein
MMKRECNVGRDRAMIEPPQAARLKERSESLTASTNRVIQ